MISLKKIPQVSSLTPIEQLLSLKLIAPKVDIKKVDISEYPDIGFLTQEQKIALDNLRRFFKGTEGKAHLLLGHAGTGKTTLITTLVHLMLHKTNMNVAIICPTHKAVKITRKLSPFTNAFREFSNDRAKVNMASHSRVHYATVHSLLGLKLSIVDGKEVYAPNKYMEGQEPIGGFDVVIVDECSMLGKSGDSKEALSLVDELLSWKDDLVLIFVGDSDQIPPVNKKGLIKGISTVFAQSYHEFHDIRVSNLITVMRQALDNPVLAMATDIRLANYRDRPKKTITSDTGGVYYIDRRDDKLDELLLKYFGSEHYKKDNDYVKVIAYHNKCVEGWNHRIRKLIYRDQYSEELPTLIPGESIITRSPILELDLETGERVVKHSNFTELKVVDPIEATISFPKAHIIGRDHTFRYYDTEVEYQCDRTGDILPSSCKILFPSELAEFEAFIEEWRQKAIKHKFAKEKNEARIAWGQYYDLQKVFAKFTYAHATTSHRSQGSSFDTVFVIEYDINTLFKSMASADYHRRLLYTSCSRASRNNIMIV